MTQPLSTTPLDENHSLELPLLKSPPSVPPKPQAPLLVHPSLDSGSGWLRIVGSYRKGVLQIVIEEFRRLGYRIAPIEIPDEHISVFWSRSFFAKLPLLRAHQKVNWMPGMNEICRKDFLGRNITAYAKRFGWKDFDFWPNSFNLPQEWDSFIEEFQQRPVPYILKPPLAARGEGIRLFTKLSDASPNDDYILSKTPLAQRYIPNPLLFHGKYKMSFRFYVALTSVDPLRLYIYQDGLVRICSTPYTTEDYSDLLVHLTNYDLQIVNESNFLESMRDVETECRLDGLRADWQEVQAMLRRQGRNVDRMWTDIQDLVVKSFIASEYLITRAVKTYVKTRGSTFELTGFDVLLDEDLKPWLLEVNHTPSLCPHTDLENDIKRHMLRDLYQLVDLEKRHLQNVRNQYDQINRLWKFRKDQKRMGAKSTKTDHSEDANSTEKLECNSEAGSSNTTSHLPPDPSVLVNPTSTACNSDYFTSTTPSPKRNVDRICSPSSQPTNSELPLSRSSTSSSSSNEPSLIEFPVDSLGNILPDKFVGTDLWCILDAQAEANRTGKWDLCFPNPASSHKYLPFLLSNRSKLIALWQQHLHDPQQLSILKGAYSDVLREE